MLIFDSRRGRFGTQKPKQWGSLSSVQSAVRRNAELSLSSGGLVIDYKNIIGFWPLWELAGQYYNIISGLSASLPADITWQHNHIYNSSALNNGILLGSSVITDHFPSGTEMTLLSWVDDTYLESEDWFGGVSSEVVQRLNTSSEIEFILNDLSGTDRVGTAFTKQNKLRFFGGGWKPGTIWASVEDTVTAATTSSTAYSLGSQEWAFGGTSYDGSRSLKGALYQHIILNKSLSPTQLAQLHDAPYLLLQPNPAPVFFDFGAGFTLAAESGAFALSGQAIALLRDSKVSADAGSLVVAGQPANLLRDSRIVADSGSITMTGQVAALLVDRLISADSGAIVLDGNDAGLIYTPIGGFTLTADSGSFTLTGSDASLLAGHKLAAETGTISLTGQAAALLYGRVLAASSGTFTVTGQDADLLRDANISAGAGSISLAGQDVTLIYSGIILPDGNISVTFTVKQPDIGFTAKAPSISFTN